MNLALWIAAGVLAAVLLVAAVNKLLIPREKLATFPGGGWVEDFSPGTLQGISTLEILGAAGLILPAVLGIAPGPGAAGRYRRGVAVCRRGELLIRAPALGSPGDPRVLRPAHPGPSALSFARPQGHVVISID